MIHEKIYIWIKKIWYATYIRFRDWLHDRRYRRYWGERTVHNGREHADKTKRRIGSIPFMNGK